MENQDAPKKISFGFSKIGKPTKKFVANTRTEKDSVKEFISHIEDNALTVKEDVNNGQASPKLSETSEPLVIIPRSLKAKKLSEENTKPSVEATTTELTLDQLAAKQILEELNSPKEKTEEILAITQAKKKKFEAEYIGEQSTIDDYENVPISSFGMAMLRGMGWDPKKQNSSTVRVKDAVPRPKGLGLGADKPARKKDEDEVLSLNCYIRVLIGKWKGSLAQVLSLADDADRILIKILENGTEVSIGEFGVERLSEEEVSKLLKKEHGDKKRKYDSYSDKRSSNK